MEDKIVGRLIYATEGGCPRIYLFCLNHGKEGVPVRQSAFLGFRQVCHMNGCSRLIVDGENGNLFPKGCVEGYLSVSEEMEEILGGSRGLAWEMSRF